MTETPNALLFSLENLKIFRDIEIFNEIYIVTLGTSIELTGSDQCRPVTQNAASTVSDEVNLVLPGKGLERWFHISTTPIFQLRRRRRHEFPGGLPLYYGKPGGTTSVYVAVMESDRRARDIAEVLHAATRDIPVTGAFEALGVLSGANATQVGLYKQAFSLIVKVIEQALINNHDDIQYTNVFTFKPSNDFLQGDSQLANHKVNLTFSVEVT